MRGASPPRTRGVVGTRFGRAIVALVLEEIAARLARIGVIGGVGVDGGKIIGPTPAGVARLMIQRDGAPVGLVPTLNFVGSSFVVTWNAAENRVDVALQSGGLEPREIIVRSTSELVTARTTSETLMTRAPA